MANKQDIFTAIRNLDLFLKIPDLKGATPRLNANGSPFAFAGGFNLVFQIYHQTKKWAFRVWHIPMGENKERYLAISKYLADSKLPYFADFIYDEKGLLVNGELMDTIRMEWLEGILLKDYIEQHLYDKGKLELLAEEFLEMAKRLSESNISHGDLQEGNILVNASGNIYLVDYDSVCIPEIEGQRELVTGLKGYQHPSRFKANRASLRADYFSELIIYLSICGLAAKPEFWTKYQVKDTTYLLFSERDFEDIESSQIYSDLKGTSSLIDTLLQILKEYILTSEYYDLKPFMDYFLSPEILLFQSNKDVVIEGGEVEFAWIVKNAISVRIEPDIGNVSNSGTYSFSPLSQTYKLFAVGYFDRCESVINLNLFPIPIIQSILVPVPKISEELIIQMHIPQIPDFNLKIAEINNGVCLLNNYLKIDIPSFNIDDFESINLVSSQVKSKVEFNIKPRFLRFPKKFSKLFYKIIYVL